MFDNIGGKIKLLAKILCWVGIVGSIFIGIFLPGVGGGVEGFLIAVICSLISWVSQFFIYGFGELIERTAENAENTKLIGRILENIEKTQPQVEKTTKIVEDGLNNISERLLMISEKKRTPTKEKKEKKEN